MTEWENLLLADAAVNADWHRRFAASIAAQAEWQDGTARLVEQAYADNPAARDAYSRVGCFLLEQGRPTEALAWFEKDLQACRAGWWQQLRHAECLAASGQLPQARQQVARVYQQFPEARNGYAMLAWRLRDAALARPDLENKRLTPGYALNVAVLLAEAGALAEAIPLVEQAYAQEPRLQDGFSRLALAPQTGLSPDGRLALFGRDATIERITPASRLAYADLLADANRWAEAKAEVARAYAADTTLRNQYAALGLKKYRQQECAAALEFYQRDAEAGRIVSEARLVFAELLARADQWTAAVAQIHQAYSEDAGLQDGYIRLARWLPPEMPPAEKVEYLNRDRLLRRATPRRVADASAALRALTTVEAELANSRAWLPPEVDPAAQYAELQQAALTGQAPAAPVPVLNCALFIASARDTAIQFRELILAENYYFKCAHETPVIIDGGANAGMALAYFKWLYPGARITAFEPHPTLFALCQKSIRHNGWKHVTLHPYALLDQAGEIAFTMPEDMPMGSSVAPRAAVQAAGNCRQTMVQSRRLSDYLTEPVDFLKLDIEGAETRVLRELGSRLGLVQRGYIEYHYGVAQGGNSLGELLALLEQAGFQYRITDPASTAEQMPLHGRRLALAQPWSCSIYFGRSPATAGTTRTAAGASCGHQST